MRLGLEAGREMRRRMSDGEWRGSVSWCRMVEVVDWVTVVCGHVMTDVGILALGFDCIHSGS